MMNTGPSSSSTSAPSTHPRHWCRWHTRSSPNGFPGSKSTTTFRATRAFPESARPFATDRRGADAASESRWPAYLAITSPEVKAALETVFAADSEFYRGRGFQRRIGYGTRPALLVIDMANAWTRPDHAFTCDNMEEIIPATQALLAAAREKRIPVIFTTTAYQDPTGPRSDTGLWHLKIPVETLLEGSEAASIDDRLDPQPGEQVIVKKRASAFHGTYLAGYLRSQRVDTVIITGVTMAGCVRHSTEDAIADGFRPIVVREAVGDRVPGVVEWNLFDIDAKFGDVEPLESVLSYLNGLPALAND